MGMKRKRLYRLFAGLLCAGLLLVDSSAGVFISAAAETRELETEAGKNVLMEDSGSYEGNGSVDDGSIEGESNLTEGSDVDGEKNSMEDSDTDGENDSTEEADTDGENDSTEDAGTDGENNSTGDAGADGENNSTEDAGAGEENDPTEDSGTGEENGSTEDTGADEEKDSTEDIDADEEKDSTEENGADEENSDIEDSDACEESNSEEDYYEAVGQSDEAELQADDAASIPRIEFIASDIYYFDATIDVHVYNCTDANRDFNILLQNISEESAPKKINFDGFHVSSLGTNYDMNLTWYFRDLKAGTTYKMWCDVEGVEQEELIFNTPSLDDLTVDVEIRPRVSGAYIRARFSKPIMEADDIDYGYGAYYDYYYPVLYYRRKGEQDWKQTTNHNTANKVDDYTIEFNIRNSHAGAVSDADNDPPETEYEYAIEFFYARRDKTKSVLFVKDKQKVSGYDAMDLDIGDYEYDTYKTTSLETAAELIKNTKWVNGEYIITASFCDTTAKYYLVYDEVDSSWNGCQIFGNNWVECTGSEEEYTNKITFEEGDLRNDKKYIYEFKVESYGGIITIDTGIISTYGGTISGSSGDDTSYEDTQRTLLEDLQPSISTIKNKTYDGKPYEPSVKVTVTENGKKKTLTQDIDYSVSYGNNVNVGTGNVTIKGKGIYKGEISKEFKITPKSIKKLKIVAGSVAQNITETDVSAGTVELPVCVYDGNRLLSRGKDYNLTFKKSAAKIVTLNVESIQGGNYTGTATASITMYKDSDQSKIINSSNVSFGETWVYTGKAIQPAVKVWMDGKYLDKKNYKVQYQNNKNAGTAYVIVTGKGTYKGKVVKPFIIKPRSTDFTIKTTIKAKTYNGKLQKPSITVTAGKTKLTKNKDYKVSYIRNLHAGTAIVKVTGIGNYEGSNGATTAFTINPQKISKVAVKGTKTAGLTVTYSGRKLREGTDYTLDYGAEKGNKVKVTITAKDGGDFTGGSVTKTVKIK